MKKFFFIAILIIILFLVGCDRFNKDYLIKITPLDFVNNYQITTIEDLKAHHVNQIMSYYDDQYLNSGIDKIEMQTFYTKNWSDQVTLNVVLLNEDSLKYRLTITDPYLRFESSWVDFGKKIGDNYYWYGNQSNGFTTMEDFINNFKIDALNALKTHQLSQLMNYYDNLYLNNGMDKSELEEFLDKNWSNQVNINVVLENSDSLKYQITISDPNLRFETTWLDYGMKIEDQYLWYGNQTNIVEIPKQIILAELITGTTCVNCPNAEHKLHDLFVANPTKLVYIEYHFQDSLALNMTDWNRYYSVNSTPTTIFQGKVKLAGGETTTLDQYQGVFDNLTGHDAQLTLTDVSLNKQGNTVTGSVKINKLEDIDLSACYLQMVIVEEETTASNYIGENSKRVVRYRNKITLNNVNTDIPIDFVCNSTKYLSNDIKLVLWVQKMNNTNLLDPQTDGVINCVEIDIR